jgi:hypothetical protein
MCSRREKSSTQHWLSLAGRLICITVMLTYVYAHFPELIITKAVIVTYIIAMVVLKVHLSSVRKPPKNQIVRIVRYGDADVCPMSTPPA